mmetsp:Transcript_65884/g.185428  ORF Transcript_65884/g.185428 Transcript_65884/m.185428 type:complete len:205 (-) Transcript_65884:272-886(-)
MPHATPVHDGRLAAGGKRGGAFPREVPVRPATAGERRVFPWSRDSQGVFRLPLHFLLRPAPVRARRSAHGTGGHGLCVRHPVHCERSLRPRRQPPRAEARREHDREDRDDPRQPAFGRRDGQQGLQGGGAGQNTEDEDQHAQPGRAVVLHHPHHRLHFPLRLRLHRRRAHGDSHPGEDDNEARDPPRAGLRPSGRVHNQPEHDR